ncbi:MAG: DUF6587 family protein [Lysobacterales bacterium]
MNAAAILQGVVIALIVGWSALFAAHRLLPVGSRRVQARILDAMDRPSLPVWLRALARRLQPRSTSGRSCGSGCSSCGGCAAAIAKPVGSQPPMFRPRTKA